ncbi:MAG: hypothetical protein PUJ57_00235 [Peptoniphilaceae bacterium]|nr:hypothetical protein [Peptoniphilaceae bacterium]MDY6086302.1 hypothetical protein [Peptoniphilaceae bacterium]
METVFKNPYQNVLETTVRAKRRQGEHLRIETADTIVPPYRKLHLAPEALSLDDGVAVTALDDGALLVPKDYDNETPVLSVPFEARLTLLRNVTARLILTAIAQTYFSRTPTFDAMSDAPEAFTMTLAGAFLPRDTAPIAALFLRRSCQWQRAGLNIQSDAQKRETTIFGMATLPWMGPHLFHTAECGVLTSEDVEAAKDALHIRFRLNDPVCLSTPL